MKIKNCLPITFGLALAILNTAIADPVLKHRYSFSDTPGGTTVLDSVGGANGVLLDINGNPPANSYFTGSSLILNDGGGNDYVRLPQHMVSTMTNLTLEVWYLPYDTQDWMRIWDFGSYTGDFLSRVGDTSSYFCGHARNFFAYGTGFQFNNAAGSDISLYKSPPIYPLDGMSQLVVIYDTVSAKARLFVNGVQIGGTAAITALLSSINDTNCTFGLSQWASNPNMQAEYNEFRMWEGAMSAAQVQLSYNSGPDSTNLNVGALQSITFNTTSPTIVGGGFQSSVTADYQNVSGVVVTANGATYLSSNPGVATINASGFVSGVSAGMATISAVFGNITNSQAIEVIAIPASLKHRWSFNEPVGSLVVTDSVGTANGTVVNGNGVGADLTGTGQINLYGGAFVAQCDVGTRGFVNLPNHIVQGLTNITVEVWATWTNQADWARLVTFGHGDAGDGCQGTGSHEICIIPRRGDVGELTWQATYFGHDEEQLHYPGQMPIGQQVYMAGVYDPLNNVMKFYVNGVLVDSMSPASGLVPLANFDDANCWFGRSNWQDPFYGGLINEVRIWQGDLTPAEVTQHYAAGPDSFAPAPTLSISKSATSVTISWMAAGATGYQLYSSSALGNGTWPGGYNLVPGVVLSSGTNSVTLPSATGSQFFVLHNP